jgi:hypothetical protein
MTEPETPTNARTPTAQELNRITSQLRELNAAYKSAVAANDSTEGDPTPDSKTGE